jgi:hypothetical protein
MLNPLWQYIYASTKRESWLFLKEMAPSTDRYMTDCLLEGHIDVSLHIWDTGGNALASPMLNSYLHEAHVRIPFSSEELIQ